MTFKAPFIRSPYNYDTEAASNDSAVDKNGPGESLTVQSMAEDADINVLMRRFGITGKMPENPRIPTYGDFTGISDFRSALEAVKQAQDSFMEIPANVRSKFNNDPQQFLEYAANPANIDGLRQLGLAKPLPVTDPNVAPPQEPPKGAPPPSPPK